MTPQNKLTPLFRAWLDIAMPDRQGMALGKVEAAACDSEAGYRCSVSLLDIQTLEETGVKIKDVAINSPGHSSGLWVLPSLGQMVVIGYLGMDSDMPFVAGCYTQGSVGPAAVEEGELLLHSEHGQQLYFKGDGSLDMQAELLSIHSKDGMLLEQEGGASIELDSTGMLALKNQSESLKGILMDLIDDLSGMKTIPAVVGSSLTLSPDNIAKIQMYKGRISALLSD